MARNYFILAGRDSREFGVYINGAGTFNAPARSYTFNQIPGRNGDLVMDGKRYENIELTYHAFIYKDFKTNIRDFRSFLLSLTGYQRLTDSYHPDEFRMVCYEGEFEAEVTPTNDAGEFDITFNCKPQRFLISGEEQTTLYPAIGEAFTESGQPAIVENEGGATLTGLTGEIRGVWQGDGNPSLENIRPINSFTSFRASRTGKNLWGSSQMLADIKETVPAAVINGDSIRYGSTFATTKGNIIWGRFKENTRYTLILTFRNSSAESGLIRPNIRVSFTDGTAVNLGRYGSVANVVSTLVYTTPEGKTLLAISKSANAGTTTLYTDRSGLFEGVISEAEFEAYNGQAQVVALGQRIYEGQFNVFTGLLTYSKIGMTLDGTENWTQNWNAPYRVFRISLSPLSLSGGRGCSHYANATVTSTSTNVGFYARDGYIQFRPDLEAIPDLDSWKAFLAAQAANGTPVQIWVGLEEEATASLSPAALTLADGDNYIMVYSGEATATGKTGVTIENPTPFPSRPLLRVFGNGTFYLNETAVTITGADTYTDIDCYSMDAFIGDENRNQHVQFSGHEFPVLKPGVNVFSFGSGITQIDVIPRWYYL